MEISVEKTKLVTNNTSGINTKIKVNRHKFWTFTSFKYLRSVITGKGSKPWMLSGIAQTTAVLTDLKPVWNNRSISLSSKIRLMCFLFTPSSCIHVNHAELQRRMQAMEMRCYCKILYSSYKDHVTNEEVCKDTAGNRTARRPPYYRKETQTEVVRTCLPFLRFQNHLARHSERGKKTRQA